jgi:hypothetical protein
VSGNDRRLLLVVGIGRSGTSVMTGVLGQLGWYVPQPEVQADDTNPRGFGEPRWVVDFHTELQKLARVSNMDSRPGAFDAMREITANRVANRRLRAWLKEQFAQAEHVVVKDPRIVWFLPMWQQCARDLGVDTSFATMLRYPTEVLTSARTWYGQWQNDASRAASWLNVMLHTEQLTRGAPRAFVRYDDVLSSWEPQVARIAAPLRAEWMVDAVATSRDAISSFVDPSLRRSQVGWDEVAVPARLRERVEKAWDQLVALTEAKGDTDAAHVALDASRADYCVFYRETELIAQLSIRAALMSEPPPPPAPPPPPTRRLQVVRRIPKPIRMLMPLGFRRRFLGVE